MVSFSSVSPFDLQVEIERVEVHPSYAFGASSIERGDIALVKLTRAVNYDTVIPAGPQATELEAPGTRLIVSGWGGVSENSTHQPGVRNLRYVEIPVVSTQTCQRLAPFRV